MWCWLLLKYALIYRFDIKWRDLNGSMPVARALVIDMTLFIYFIFYY